MLILSQGAPKNVLNFAWLAAKLFLISKMVGFQVSYVHIH